MGWEEIFSPVGENPNENFGSGVAISGNYAIVGANRFGTDEKGKAYWYERQRDGKWKEVHTQPGENGGDSFGHSVGISGNYAIVGAYNFDGGRGKVYWYQRQRDGKWVKIHEQPGENRVNDLERVWGLAGIMPLLVRMNLMEIEAKFIGTREKGTESGCKFTNNPETNNPVSMKVKNLDRVWGLAGIMLLLVHLGLDQLL